MSLSRSSHWPRAVLPWLRAAVVLALLVIIVETFFVMGIVRPMVIEGSSMAPALLGPHVRVGCPHCHWEFAVGADQLPGAWPLVCPDCRESFRQPEDAPVIRGRRLWVDRTRYARRPPERFEIVVFRCPEQASQLCVKRIIGLPGEKISFGHGDLYVDGNVVRKSLAEQLKSRQLVHREREQLRRWQADSPDWKWRDGGWQHTGEKPGVLAFEPAGGQVTDDLGINQRAARQLNIVADLMVTCNATLAPGAKLEFHANFAREVYSGEAASAAGRVHVVWSLFDQQAVLWENGNIIWQVARDEPWPAPPRLAIAATGEVRLDELSVWRDAYYHTRMADRWPRQAVGLEAGEYFVLGDNVAISADSRSWPRPGLPEGRILGAPLFVD